MGPFPCCHTVQDTPEHVPPHLGEGLCSAYPTVIPLSRFHSIVFMNSWTCLDSFSLAEVAANLLSLTLTAICSYMPNKLLRHTEKNGAHFSKTACVIFISCLFCNGTVAGPLIYYVNSELRSGHYLTIHSNIWAVFIFLFFFPTPKISPILIKIKYLEDQFMRQIYIYIYMSQDPK